MTELVELVQIGLVSEDTVPECPFEHTTHTCGSAANTISGNADKLGKNLEKTGKAGTVVVRSGESPYSTHVRDTQDQPCEAYPWVAPTAHPDWFNWVQLVPGNENTWYPVVFQAHHLVPGDGSLKGADKLLQFIAKEGSSAICCDLGYDVDGKENGVWLPGKSAVAGGDLGIKLWGSAVATRSLPDKEYTTRRAATRVEKDLESGQYTSASELFVPLGGGTPSSSSKEPLNKVFHPRNLKWLYVQKASTLATPHRQFHDSHTVYYTKVKNHLNDIGVLLERFRISDTKYSCKECSKPDAKKPPPVGLLGMLNKLSSIMRGKVLGPTSDSAYYTSNWSDATRIQAAKTMGAVD